MFDELSGLENQSEAQQASVEEADKPARSLSRWSHVIAGIVFCLVYFPFQGHPWNWPVACAVSYTVFVFAIALGLSLDDADDFFGDPRVSKVVAILLLPHALILMPVTFFAYLWLRAIPLLPLWVTEAHRLSLWQMCILVAVWFAGTREGVWMSGEIKRRLRTRER